MGLQLDNYSFPEAIKIIDSFLTDTALSTVLSVNMEKLLCAGEDPVVKDVLSSADYTVITDKAIPESASEGGAERIFEVEQGAFLTAFLNHMYHTDRTFYLVAGSKADLLQMRRAMTEAFSYVRILGESVITNDLHESENCVNAINILVPDVILSSLDSPDEERFLNRYRSQLCARIWYGAGKEPMLEKEGFGIIRAIRRKIHKMMFRSRLHY